MRYIVSGYRRSGTSLMMHILKLTMPDIKLFDFGPKTHEDAYKTLEWLNTPVQGYVPSPLSILEVPHNIAKTPEFLRLLPDHTLVKLFFDVLPYLPGRRGEGGGLCTEPDPAYTIIFMKRSQAEIEKSLEKVAWHGAQIGKQDPRDHRKYKTPFDVYEPYNQEDIDHVLSIMDQRADVALWTMSFETLTEEPKRAIEHLCSCLDLPVSQDAIDLVKPELRRARA